MEKGPSLTPKYWTSESWKKCRRVYLIPSSLKFHPSLPNNFVFCSLKSLLLVNVVEKNKQCLETCNCLTAKILFIFFCNYYFANVVVLQRKEDTHGYTGHLWLWNFWSKQVLCNCYTCEKLDILNPFMKGEQHENTFFNSSSPKRVVNIKFSPCNTCIYALQNKVVLRDQVLNYLECQWSHKK